ncbi:MAG: hypothetical protein IPM64_11180 [Phycisphaerales bacterium]|nr:hypothetical protein [Phycisphaerales bacterium]
MSPPARCRALPRWVAVGVLLSWVTAATAAEVVLSATADAMAREMAPTTNYGTSGGLAASGSAAVNGAGQARGRAETILRFEAGPAVAAFDAAYGSGDWTVTSILLEITEIAEPGNPLFARGAGDFSIRWTSGDLWSEGPGSPQAPTTGVGDEVTWNTLTALIGSSSLAPLGNFSRLGVDGVRFLPLTPAAELLADIGAGSDVSLLASPLTDGLGMTFYSRSGAGAASAPKLIIRAVPEPCTAGLIALGLFLARGNRSRSTRVSNGRLNPPRSRASRD